MKSREDKFKVLMNEKDIEGAIVLSPENFHYITGFASHQLTVSRQPGFASAIVHKSNEIPTQIIGMDFETPAFYEKSTGFIIKKYDTWVGVREREDLISYTEKTDGAKFLNSMDVIVNTIKELDLGNKTIGIELDYLPYNYYQLLCSRLPEVNFVNISDMFIYSRSVKTTEEIEKFRELTKVSDEALNHTSKFVKIGVSENELIQIYRNYVMESGICTPSSWSMFTTGANSSRLAIPTERRIENGDTLKFDGGVNAEFDFYTTDFSRTWIIGEGDKDIVELKDKLYEAQRLMINSAKPGLPINELFNIGFNYVKDKMGSYKRGHLGHNISMGPQTAENPFITSTERRVLESGMILCIEVPCYIKDTGGFNIEDMVLITENGCEVLTHRTPHYL